MLSARNSPFAAATCMSCAMCNDPCAANCEKFRDYKLMAACAKSCRDWATARREVIQHLKHECGALEGRPTSLTGLPAERLPEHARGQALGSEVRNRRWSGFSSGQIKQALASPL